MSMMAFKILLFALSDVVSGMVFNNYCRLSDIKSIFGGQDYTVDHMRGIHFVHQGREQLLLFGRFTKNESAVKKGFIFLYDYLFCESIEIWETKSASQGFVEAYYYSRVFFFGTLYFLSYAENAKDGQVEVVTKFSLYDYRYLGRYVDITDNKYEYISAKFQDRAIDNGFFTTDFQVSDSIFVVSPTEVRLYEFKDLASANAKSLKLDNSLPFIAAADLKDIALQYYGLLSADSTRMEFIITKDFGSYYKSELTTEETIKTDAKMILQHHEEAEKVTALIVLKMEMPTIIKWTVSTNGELSYNQVLQYELNLNLKVMHISTDNGEQQFIYLIALDENNRMRKIVISIMQDGLEVSKTQMSDPLDYIDFNKTIPRGAASIDNWDYWLFGVTDTMTLQGRPLLLQNQIGFIMSTEKNRLTQLWAYDADDLYATEIDAVADFYEEIQETDEQTTFQTGIVILSEAILSIYLPFVEFKEKNDWIRSQQETCNKDIGLKDVESTCLYYDIFDTPSLPFLDITNSSKQIPTSSSDCQNLQRQQFNKYEALADDIKAIRNICYSRQREILSSINPPLNSQNQPMIQIDKLNQELYWIEKGDVTLDRKSWIVRIDELSDDMYQIGFNVRASFKFKRISHINLAFDGTQGGKPTIFNFFPEDQAYDFIVKVACWSPECPSYIKKNDYSLYTEMGNQNAKQNTYVYFIETSQKSKVSVNQYTLSFNVTRREDAPAPGGINITYDFQEWYKNNKAQIPFYAPPTIDETVKKDLILDEYYLDKDNYSEDQSSNKQVVRQRRKFIKTELQQKLDPLIFRYISDWYDSEILVALQEARERLKTRIIENQPKVTMDQKGIIKVIFQDDIKMPSYLKKEISQLLATKQSIQETQKQRRDRRLSLFKEEDDYEFHKEDLLSPFQYEELQEEFVYDQLEEVGVFDPDYEEAIDDLEYDENEQTDGQEDDEGSDEDQYTDGQEDDEALDEDEYTDGKEDDEGLDEDEYTDGQEDNEGSDEDEYTDGQEDGDDAGSDEYDQNTEDCDPEFEPECIDVGGYCDLTNDPDCSFEELQGCDPNIGNCTLSYICVSFVDPDCTQECDPFIDPECLLNYQKPQTQCDPSDPSCIKYEKPEELARSQDQKRYVCDKNDPNSECYSPIPENLICPETKYLDETTKTCENLQIFFGHFNDLFELEVLKNDTINFTETRRVLKTEFNKKLVSASESKFVIQLYFDDPFLMAQFNKLKVRANFTSFNPGITMSEVTIPLARLAFNNTATKAIDSIAKASQTAVIAAAVGSVLMQTLLTASLSQLWNMINNIQLIIHIPCINLQFPANAFLTLKQLIMIATFELPYFNYGALKGYWRIQKVQVLNDMPPNLVSNMFQLGYNDNNISETLGTVYVINHLTILGLIIILITLPFKRFKCCKRFNRWMRIKMQWNFVIRLILEQTLETLFSVVLTLKYSRFTTSAFGSATDYIFSIIFAALIGILPFFMVIFYLKYFSDWQNNEFDQKYGAPLDGLKKGHKSSLFFSIYFVIRRSLFCLITFTMYRSVILQLHFNYLLTMVSIAYLTNYAPQDDQLAYRLELMNECISVFILDLCYLFTDLDPDPRRQYNWGFVFIVLIFSCVGVHVVFLIKAIIKEIIHKFKMSKKFGLKQVFQGMIRKKIVNEALALKLMRQQSIANAEAPKNTSLQFQQSNEENEEIQQDSQSQQSMSGESYYQQDEENKSEPQLLLRPVENSERQINCVVNFEDEEFKTVQNNMTTNRKLLITDDDAVLERDYIGIFRPVQQMQRLSSYVARFEEDKFESKQNQMIQTSQRKLLITDDEDVLVRFDSGEIKKPISSDKKYQIEDDEKTNQIYNMIPLADNIEECIDFEAYTDNQKQQTVDSKLAGSKIILNEQQTQNVIREDLTKTVELKLKIGKVDYGDESKNYFKVVTMRIKQYQHPEIKQLNEIVKEELGQYEDINL